MSIDAPPEAILVRLFSNRAFPWSISACRAARATAGESQRGRSGFAFRAHAGSWGPGLFGLERARAHAAPRAATPGVPLSALSFLLLLPPMCENCCGGLLSTALFMVRSRSARRASSIAWCPEEERSAHAELEAAPRKPSDLLARLLLKGRRHALRLCAAATGNDTSNGEGTGARR